MTSSILRSRPDHAHETFSCSVADSCRFCRLYERNELFGELYGRNQVLDVANVPDGFHIAMDCFPLGYRGAHLLLIPGSHYRSLAEVPSHEQLIKARDVTAELLLRLHPHHWLLVFEHGPGELDGQELRCGGCHVDHAHGHMLMLSVDVEFEDIRERVETSLDRLDWDLESQRTPSAEPFVDIHELVGTAPYLHIGAIGRRTSFSYTYRQDLPSQAIPSQLLRRIIAEASGSPQPTYWNWKIVLQHQLEGRLAEFAADIAAFHEDIERARAVLSI